MTEFRSLPEDVVDEIVKQIGLGLENLRPIPTLGGASELKLFETVDIWSLRSDLLLESTNDLTILAKPTGRWHHQIKINGVPTSYARSVANGPSALDWHVVGVFESPIATKIDDAINWIDGNISGDYVVRLLTVPCYQIQAFWLVNNDNSQPQQIVLISAPAEYSTLDYERAYAVDEFLDVLRTVNNIQGLCY
ncbi:MAG: hypothetical protein AAF208_05730 [Cyanobacteria bacterium P01_A01_bin.45]